MKYILVFLTLFAASCTNGDIEKVISKQETLNKKDIQIINDEDERLIYKTNTDEEITINRQADGEDVGLTITNVNEIKQSTEGNVPEGILNKTTEDKELAAKRKAEQEIEHFDYEQSEIIEKNEQQDETKPQAHFTQKGYRFANIILKPTSYKHLKNWNDSHNFNLARLSFLNICKLAKTRDVDFKNSILNLGSSKDYELLCDKITGLNRNADIRDFFEQNFTPFKIFDTKAETDKGLFTGYYRIEMQGCVSKTAQCKYPVYKRPFDMRKGEKYYTRKQIYNGALKAQRLEIIWLKDVVDHYLLHIQGTGIVTLDSGQKVFLSFDGKNGHEYSSVASHARQNGFAGSGMHFYDWMRQDPKRAEDILSYNKSYIFFKISDNMDVIGGSGMSLLPFASMAVDTSYIPYGSVLYLSTDKTPYADEGVNGIFMAQDTGSDIKGAIRGDIYFGSGQNADFMAHRTKVQGSYFILLPNKSQTMRQIKQTYQSADIN